MYTSSYKNMCVCAHADVRLFSDVPTVCVGMDMYTLRNIQIHERA